MKLEAGTLLRSPYAEFPDNFVEAFEAAVQGVGTIVDGQSVLLAIEAELAARDSVSIAPDQTAEERAVGNVGIEVVVAEHDVAHFAVAVRTLERHENAVGR